MLVGGTTLAQDADPAFDPEAVFAESRLSLTLRVDPAHAASSDDNPGTLDAPLTTLTRALELADAANAAGQGVWIQVADGVYRESLALARSGTTTDAPLVIEADTPGGAVISGADIWTTWENLGTTNTYDGEATVYAHPWPYDWGLAAIPQAWLDAGLNVPVPDILRRRELIAINGLLLHQALSEVEARQLAESFYIDEAADRALIVTQKPIQNSLVEVAVRPVLLSIHERANIALKGLQFRHASTVYDSAVQIQRSQNLWLERNAFVWNSAGGLGLNRSTSIIGRYNLYADNGGTGYGGGFNTRLLSEDEAAYRNNWRGAQGDFLGWSQAGVKHLYLRDATYRRLNVSDNRAHGLWLDSDNVDVVIESAEIHRNWNSGLYLEVSRGPVLVRDTTISANLIAGIRAANLANLTLQGNRLYDNQFAQIYITGENNGREITNRDTGERVNLSPAENWTLLDNTVLNSAPGAPLVRLTLSSSPWETFVTTLVAGRNLWHDATGEAAFQLGEQVLNFAQWQQMTGQDLTSTFGPVAD
jgi:hypothetical protein